MTKATDSLTREQMSALVICARELGVDPASLKASNPWALDTPRSMSIQALMLSRFPRIAQGLIEAAEVPLSLGAAALVDGVEGVVVTDALAREVASARPERWAELQAEKRAKDIAAFEQSMAAQKVARAESNQRAEAQLADMRMQSIQVARASMNPQGY